MSDIENPHKTAPMRAGYWAPELPDEVEAKLTRLTEVLKVLQEWVNAERHPTWEDTWRESHQACLSRATWKASGPYRGRQLVRQRNILLRRKGMKWVFGRWYVRVEGTDDWKEMK